jgi:hypothetical protein
MTWIRGLTVIAVVAAGCFVSAAVEAATYASRQYYGGWSYNRTQKYYHRSYYYKPSPSYYGYKHHTVVYKPSYDRRHYYFYNPYNKKYWGRCPATYYGNKGYAPGTQGYARLAPEDQKGDLKEIPPTAFPKVGKMPQIPEGKDDVQMDLPPDDPPGPGLPKAGE